LNGQAWQPYQYTRSYRMADYLKPQIFTADFFAATRPVSAADGFGRPESGMAPEILVTKFLLEGYLRENGMAQGDRLASAHGIELRLPFSDYRLAETIVGLRKHHGGASLGPKEWLKGALGPTLPDWVLNRQKTGFAPPGLVWIRALNTAYGANLLNGHLVGNGILNSNAAQRFLDSASRLSAWFQLCFSMLVLEIWAQEMDSLAKQSRREKLGALLSARREMSEKDQSGGNPIYDE
jgi:hypothetical protein